MHPLGLSGSPSSGSSPHGNEAVEHVTPARSPAEPLSPLPSTEQSFGVEEPHRSSSLPGLDPEGRYVRPAPIGKGGMGEVWRVRDQLLNRDVVLKVVRRGLAGSVAARRLRIEAEITGSLQHPGVVPVHDMGVLSDGRPFYVMREVRGQTLEEVLLQLHALSGERWETTPSGWTFRRLVDAFQRVCETVACAHAAGIVHRDIKPANVMLEEFGGVLVVDWGIARILDQKEDPGQLPLVGAGTQQGFSLGTPGFMSPEQAEGRHLEVGPQSDVFALGALLHTLLYGRTPNSPALPGPHPPVPAALAAAASCAMAIAPEDRFPHAGVLAAEIAAWLDGARRRDQALGLVEAADRLAPNVADRRRRAGQLRSEAAASLATLGPFAPAHQKEEAWELEEEAQEQEDLAVVTEEEWLAALQGALDLVPELEEAHERLALHWRVVHERALIGGDRTVATRAELRLRRHDRGAHGAWLSDRGQLALVVDPPGAQVTLWRYHREGRRLVARPERDLGPAPIGPLEVPAGSGLLEIRSPGRLVGRIPIQVPRGGTWDLRPPGTQGPGILILPPVEEVPEGAVWMPAGWAWTGGDLEALDGLPARQLWIDELWVQRFPVTHAEYLCFLHDLIMRGLLREAIEAEPMVDRGGVHRCFYPRGADGLPHMPTGPDAPPIDAPVTWVSWPGARAYAAWWSARTGRSWRLPTGVEWEKAARGVDGRRMPWGDFAEPTWFANVAADDGPPRVRPVDSFPIDESPYGVRGMAGNVRTWCLNAYQRQGVPDLEGRPAVEIASPDAPFIEVRGATFNASPNIAHAAARFGTNPAERFGVIGFRLVSPLVG